MSTSSTFHSTHLRIFGWDTLKSPASPLRSLRLSPEYPLRFLAIAPPQLSHKAHTSISSIQSHPTLERTLVSPDTLHDHRYTAFLYRDIVHGTLLDMTRYTAQRDGEPGQRHRDEEKKLRDACYVESAITRRVTDNAIS